MKMNDTEKTVWVDVETTGLDETDGLLIEIALLVADADLKPIAGYQSIVQWGPLDWDGKIDSFVTEMHRKSGLMESYAKEHGETVRVVEDAAIDFLVRNEVVGVPLCGSNVANFDRRWLKEFMPELEACFHYRNIDSSTIKEACRRWNPEVYAQLPPKKEEHRAWTDVQESVNEFVFYRDNFLFTTR